MGNMVLKLTEKNFEAEVLKTKEPVFVDFHAAWCGPCQIAAPVVEELAKEYQGKVKVVKIDVDENQALAQKFGVMSIPTVIVFKEGKEIKRLIGFPGKAGYEELLKGVLGR